MVDNKIIKQYDDAQVFNMPSLHDDKVEREAVLEKAEDIQRRAYEEGFASGEKAGLQSGEQKAALLIDRLEKILMEISAFKENIVHEVEHQVVDLSVAIAHRIVIEEIKTNPDIIVTMVKEAMKRLERMGTIKIKINPSLYELFMSKKPEIMEVHPDIAFDVDSSVPVTGPLVISETEEVVTDIDSLMNNIIEEMKGSIRHEEDEE